MTNREHLYRWLVNQKGWLYLREIPHERFKMTKVTCSSALTAMCEQGRAESRVVGLKQYRAIPNVVITKGPKPSKD